MAELEFTVHSNYEEIGRMRRELVGLKNEIRSFPAGGAPRDLAVLQDRLSQTSTRLRQLTQETAQMSAALDGQFTRGVQKAQMAFNGLIGTLRSPIGGAMGIMGLGALGGFIQQLTNVRGQFQQMQTMITTMLGQTKGNKIFDELKEFAKISPLSYQQTVGQAQQMLGFGIQAEKVVPFLKAISDVSMGDNRRFQQLSLAFSQMSAAGKLMGQDLMQMVNAGFQPLQIISEKTGKSIGKLKEEMSKGKISAEMVQQAFIDATSQGGKYFNLSANASKTIPGQLSMLEDAFDALLNDLGTKSEGVFIKIIEGATSLVENYKEIAHVLGPVIATFGVYKAITIANAAMEKRANEARSKAIVEGYKEELKKAKELKDARAGLAAQSVTDASAASTAKVVKGARYNAQTSDRLAKQIFADSEPETDKEGIMAQIDELRSQKERRKAEYEEDFRSKPSKDWWENRDRSLSNSKNRKKWKEDVRNSYLVDNAEYDKKIADLEMMLDGEGKQLKHFNDEIERLENKKQEIEGNLKLPTQKLRSRDTSVRNLQYDQKADKSRLNTVEKDIADFNMEHEGQSDDSLKPFEKDQRDSLLKEKESLEKSIADRQKKIDEAVAKRQEAQKIYDDAAKTADKEIVDLDKKLADLKAKRDEIQKLEQDKEAKQQQKRDRLNKYSDAIEAPEGSTVRQQAQLQLFQDEYNHLTPEERVSDVGKELHEQIEGIKADLSGLANLDSDLQDSVDMGFISKGMAQQVQEARNHVEDMKAAGQEISSALGEGVEEGSEEVSGGIGETAGEIADTVKEKMGELSEAAKKGGEALESNAASQQAGTQAANADTAATEANAVAKGTNTQATKGNSVAKGTNSAAARGNAAAQNVDTAATKTNSIWMRMGAQGAKLYAGAKHMLTGAINGAKNSLKAFKAELMSNPIGFAITAITMLVTTLMSLKSANEEAEKESSEFAEATNKATRDVDMMYAVLAATDKNSNVYKDTLQKLTQIAKDYGLQLNEESDIYSQLIAKRSQLIELIKEEGKQKQIAKNVEAYRNTLGTHETNLKNDLDNTDIGDSEMKDVYKDVIAEDVFNNIDKLTELQNKIKEVNTEWNELKGKGWHQLSDSEKAQYDEYQAQVAALIEQRKSIALGRAMSIAAQNGESDIFRASYGILKDIDKFTPKIQATTKALNQYTKSAADAAAKQNALKDEVKETPIDKMDVSKLAEGLKKAAKEIEDNKLPTVSPKVDTSALDDLNKRLADAKKKAEEANGTTVAPKGDTSGPDAVADASDKATAKTNETSAQTAAPQGDTTGLDQVTDSGQKASDKVQEVDSQTAQPTIDTSSIAYAIQQLDLVIFKMNQINGTQVSGALTAQEKAQLDDLYNNKTRLVKGADGKMYRRGTRADLAKIDKLEKLAKSGMKFDFGNGLGSVDLTADQIPVMTYLRRKKEYINKGGLDPSRMSAMDRQIFEGIKADTEMRTRTEQAKAGNDAWKSYKAEIDKRVKNIKTTDEQTALLKELKPIRNSLDHDSKEFKELDKTIKELEGKWKPKNKKGGNSDDPKQREWERKRAEEEDDRNIREAIKKREQEQEDERIDMMEEGFAKQIAVIKNEGKKKRDAAVAEAEALARQLEDADRALWKKEGKGTGKNARKDWQWDVKGREDTKTYAEYVNSLEDKSKAVTEEEYYAKMNHNAKSKDFYRKRAEEQMASPQKITNATEKETKELAKLYKKQQENWREMIKTYGNYEQRRKAITDDYNQKIEEALKEGNTGTAVTLGIQRDDELKNLKTEDLFREINWEGIFNNYYEQSAEALQKLRDDLKQILETNRLTLSVEGTEQIEAKIKELQGRIKEAQTQQPGWLDQIAGGSWLGPILEQRRKDREEKEHRDELQKNADAKKKEHEESKTRLLDQQKLIRQTLSDNGVDVSKLKPEDINAGSMGKYINQFQNNPALQQKMAGMASELSSAVAAEATAGAAASEAAAGAAAGAGGGGGGGGGGFAMTDAIIHGVNANMQSMPEFLEKIGAGETTFAKGMESFAESSQYATDAFDSMKSGDIVGVVSNLTSAFGTLGDALGKWGIAGMGSSDNTLQEDIERLTAVNEELITSIDKLRDELEDASTSDATRITKQMIDNLEKSEANTKNLMRRSGAEYNNGFLGIGGKGSTNKYINKGMEESDWRRASEAAGTTLRNATDLWNLSSKQMSDLQKNAPELYQKLKDLATKGSSDAAQFMDTYASMWQQTEDITDAYITKMTSMSFDTLESNFASLLKNLTDDTADFSKSFTEMMKNAIIDGLVQDKYKEKLEAWQKKFADFREADSAGGTQMTADEQRELRAEWMNMTNEARQDVKDIAEILEWDSYEAQSATAKAYQGMTQEQGSEISGRLTAIAESTESINLLTLTNGVTLRQISDNALRAALACEDLYLMNFDFANQIAQCYIEMQQINQNTAAVVKPIKEMSADINDMRTKIMNLNI